MRLRELLREAQFNSKQQVIDYFVKIGKSAAAGAAAWERGWRGHQPKKKEPTLKPPVRSYHDELDDKRYGDDVKEDATQDLEQDLKSSGATSYNAIDKLMKRIAKDNGITPDKLHDKFVEKHGMIPDEWIKEKKPNILKIIREVMPLILNELGLKSLPRIKIVKQVNDAEQPTFGKYVNETDTIFLAIENRHPIDIIRTLAHEMAHYKQDVLKKLKPNSGDTGSSIENEAHVIAGIIMRHIDKKYPNFLKLDNVEVK